jgi:hypothetical protein
LVIGWQDGFFVQVGNPTILQEIPYGGYKFYVEFVSDFWTWGSGTWELQSIFESVYAIEPGTGNHVNTGAISIAWRRSGDYPYTALVLDMPALDNHYYWSQFPVPPSDYWLQNNAPIPDMPFITNPP